MSSSLRPTPRIVRIAPASCWPWPSLADVLELWSFRALLVQLVTRDIRVRYAQTLLGAAWAVLQPVASMAIFTIVFGYLAEVPSGDVPYAIMALAGLVPWTYFATAVAASSDSVLTNRELITKIYFPRFVIPLAPIMAGLVDFGIGLAVLLGAVLFWDTSRLSASILLLPVPVLVMMIAASGLGILAAALNIRFRDFRYIVPFVLQTGLFASPVIFPLDIVPQHFRLVVALNPMTGVIETIRAILFGGAIPWGVLGVSSTAAFGLIVAGVAYFRHSEQLFADLV